MFKMIDADNSGHITLEELKTGLEKVGANLNDSEIVSLMQAVSICMLCSRELLCALYTALNSIKNYDQLLYMSHQSSLIGRLDY